MLTDPDKFITDTVSQSICDEISDPGWMRVSCDLYICCWQEYSFEQLVAHNDLLLSMQQRGEVYYVQDLFGVYFFSDSYDLFLDRLEEYFSDRMCA